MKKTHLLLTALLLAALTALAAGCGGGSSKDAKALLKRGFSNQIKSANITIDANVQVDGVAQLSKPIRVKLGGPYQSNGPRKLPSLQWDLSFSGGGQTFSAGVTTTADNAFVNFQGTNYEVGKATVAKYNQQLAQRNPGGNGSLKQFGVDALNWVKDAKEEGDSTVAGVQTKHVSAGLDVGRFFNDINKIVSKARGGIGGATATPTQITSQQIDQIKKVVKNPKFDVYVGKADGKFRRISVSLDFKVPDSAKSSAKGVSGGNVNLSIEFAGVGEPQHIAAPTNAKPISQLASQLPGGLGGALGGATGGAGGLGGGAGAGGAGTGKSPSSQQFQRYSACLNKAKPSDVAAIQRCAQLLK